jgi:hypothetical protein
MPEVERGSVMPRLNTKSELGLKMKVSQQRVRTLKKAIQREIERQEKIKAKAKHAPE